MGALTGELRETTGNDDEDTEEDKEHDTVQVANETEVDIAIGKTKSAKIKKAVIHESAHCNIIQKGVEKMKAMNLPAIWHRKKQRMLREQIAIRDSIYNNVINASSDNVMCNIVNELQDKTDGNLFGTWDIELNSYM